MKRKRRTIMFIMAMTTLTYNMVHPVTPQLIAEQNQGPFFMGVVFAAMALANFAMSPVWGRLSDRYGRKSIMVIAPIGYAFAQIGFGYALKPEWNLLFRLLAGSMVSASFIGGTAYIIDVSKSEERSKHLAFYTALTSFTGTLGYMVGGWIGNEDYHHAFILQFIMSVFLGLMIRFILPESYTKKRDEIKSVSVERTNPHLEWNVAVVLVLLVVFLTGMIYKGFDISFNAYLKFSLSFTPFQIGLAMATSGLIGLITNFIVYPFLKRRYHDYGLLLTAIIVMGVTSLFFILDLSLLVQSLLMVFFFACLALYKPLLQAILSKMGNRNGEIMGWNNAANAIGLVIGSSVLGAVYEYHAPYAFLTLSLTAFMAVGLLWFNRADLMPYAKEDNYETFGSPSDARKKNFTRSEMGETDVPDHL